jgi:predicted DCC family thiol-disulfide oxidoreductase YuxK
VDGTTRAHVVLFDGHCAFCRAQAARLARWAGRGAVELRDFQEDGVLDAFPTLTHEACMKAMHLVAHDGRVFVGAEAVARAMMTAWWLWPFAWVYYVPGVRWLAERAYAWIARRRYRLRRVGGKTVECDGDTCRVHY